MDISFHYCAVKTLAMKAGFDEASADIIATFSEYIDDHNKITHIKCDNIPAWLKDHPDVDLFSEGSLTNFNPATTGFSNWVDYAWLVTPGAQKFTVSPFHFIPKNMGSVRSGINARTSPSSIYDRTFISVNLQCAKAEYQSGNIIDDYAPKILPKNLALMQIGMLLHTFADTYAH